MKNYINGKDITQFCEGNGWLFFSFAARNCRLGDINDDGNINTRDALMSIRFAKKDLSPSGDSRREAADVNEDSKPDTKDSMMIINAAKTRTDPFFKMGDPV